MRVRGHRAEVSEMMVNRQRAESPQSSPMPLIGSPLNYPFLPISLPQVMCDLLDSNRYKAQRAIDLTIKMPLNIFC